MVCIDNRGSLHRGAAWEAWLRGRLGQVELTDQVLTNSSTVLYCTDQSETRISHSVVNFDPVVLVLYVKLTKENEKEGETFF